MIPPAPPLVPPDIWAAEMRSHCQCAHKLEPLDAIGMLMGTYFVVNNWGRNWLGTAIGGVMVYLHGARYIAGERGVDCMQVC